MDLDPTVRSKIQVEEYEAGHMMYTHKPSLKKLKADLTKFFGPG